MTDQEIFELVAAGERRGVEFKGPRSRTSRQQLAEVARAVLGLTNTRDGGLVLVGVSDAREIQGLSAGDADSWRRADDVRSSLARFADPFVQVDTELITIAAAGPAQGRTVAVLTVHEFEITPVLCADQVLPPAAPRSCAEAHVTFAAIKCPRQLKSPIMHTCENCSTLRSRRACANF